MMSFLVAALLTISLQDQFDAAEIGDATQSMTFESSGTFVLRRDEGKPKQTVAKGSWKTDDSSLEVKITSCKGPACTQIGKGFTANIDLVAERAMTVDSNPKDSPLGSGSYYCHYQGCEKRSGVVIAAHSAHPSVMRYLVDFLVDKNRQRNLTVVWWGKHLPEKQPSSVLTYCRRDEARGKAAAEQAAKDLAELSWMGSVSVQPGGTDCLWDAQLVIGDSVELPAKAPKK